MKSVFETNVGKYVQVEFIIEIIEVHLDKNLRTVFCSGREQNRHFTTPFFLQ